MIGTQETGRIDNICIQATVHSGLTVTHNGKAARLAIIDESGHVIASGEDVAKEARAVAINSYRAFLKGQGHLRVLSGPVTPARGD